MSMQAAGVALDWDVADRMRKSLRVTGIGVQEMADYLDVARNTVGNWINGRIHPSTQTLRLWALRTGVSFEWLRDGTEAAPAGPGGGMTDPRGRDATPGAEGDDECAIRDSNPEPADMEPLAA